MANVELYFDGTVALKKNEIVRVWSGMQEGGLIRVGRLENVSAGSQQTSRIVGTVMTQSPVDLNPPITGVIVGSEIRNKSTYFTLATGVYLEPERFIRDGSHQEGQDVLKTILRAETGSYVKVMDPSRHRKRSTTGSGLRPTRTTRSVSATTMGHRESRSAAARTQA